MERYGQLRAFCEETDYMYYVDAEALTYDRSTRQFTDHAADLFLKDQIHLTDAARKVWAEKWILPMMEKLSMER